MHEATLRVRYRSLYAELSKDHNVKIKLWCNNRWDLLSIAGPGYEGALRTLTDELGIYGAVDGEEETLVFTSTCLLRHGSDLIEDYLFEHDCRSLPPLTYTDGHIHLRTVAERFEHLSNLYEELVREFEVSVVAKRDLGEEGYGAPLLFPPPKLTTKRQEEALGVAYEGGYYEIPRRTRTVDLAEELDVDRRTFENHLRRAENKLVSWFIERS